MATESDAPPRPAGFRGQLGWISYEMAGGPYFNLIRIFVFAPYFAAGLIGDRVRGQELWGYVEGLSGLAVALLAAPLGAMAEAYGPRKPGMALFTLILIGGVFFLWTAAPGSPPAPIMLALIISAAVAEFAYLYHNSMLALIAPTGRIGFISGAGYSANYLGTLIIILPWLMLIGNANVPPFGLDRSVSEDVRIVGPIAAVWFLLCAIPFFLWTPDMKRLGPGPIRAVGIGLANLGRTISNARHYSNITRYLVARMIYYDGLVATYTFTGIFAAGVFGWSPAQVAIYGLVVFSILVFAGVLGGIVDDIIGSKTTILVGLFIVMSTLVFALGLGPEHILFTRAVSAGENALGLPFIGPLFSSLGFTRVTEQAFVLTGVTGGVFLGPALASSRTMLARLAPANMMAEFFGIYTLAGKATSFVAPLTIALVTRLTHDLRLGFAVVIVFIAAGFIGLTGVREERSLAADR
ncbi:MAG: MFS transporter [Alphaproteobacteria bacterium]